MARLPLVETTDSEVTAVYEQAFPQLSAFANQIKTLAHQPLIAKNLVTLYLGFGEHSTVPRHLIELAILAVSNTNRCHYCVTHHAPLGIEFGLAKEQLKVLEDEEWATAVYFNAVEKAVITYAVQITKDARRVSDSLFTELQAHFNEAQIVELTVRIGLANFFNRFNDALRLDIEPEALIAKIK